MKSRLKFLWVFLALLASCASVEEQVVTSLLKEYVAAQQALASDNQTAALDALRALTKEADAEIKEAALKALEASDLEKTRGAFKLISDRVVNIEIPKGYVVAYCPMADDGNGASWVQKEGEIANPYLGEKMLRCGTVTKKGGEEAAPSATGD